MLSFGRLLLVCACALTLGIHSVSAGVFNDYNFPPNTTGRFQEWLEILMRPVRGNNYTWASKAVAEAVRRFFTTVWKGGKVNVDPNSELNFTVPDWLDLDLYKTEVTHKVSLHRQNDFVDMDLKLDGVFDRMKWKTNTERHLIVPQIFLSWPEARYSFLVSIRPTDPEKPVRTGTLEVTLRNQKVSLDLATEEGQLSPFCVVEAGLLCGVSCRVTELRMDENQTPLAADEEAQVKRALDWFMNGPFSFLNTDLEYAFISAVKEAESRSASKHKEVLPPNCAHLE